MLSPRVSERAAANAATPSSSRVALIGIGLLGFLAAALAAVAGGRAYTANSRPPSSWFGLTSGSGYRPGGPWLAGGLLVLAAFALVLAWLAAIALHARSGVSERAAWAMAASWGLPLALGPPLMSKDVYAYAAQGISARHGIDVYQSGVAALSRVGSADAARALAAVDPRWRDTPTPYGPLGVAIERAAATIAGDSPVGTVLVLRAVCVASVVAVVALAVALAGGHPAARVNALLLVALNPLLLFHGLSAAHLDAPICALLLAAVLAARHRRWPWAVLAVAAAAAIKAPTLVALPAVLIAHALATQLTGRRRVAALATDVAVAIVGFGLLSLLVPHGFGWLHTLSTSNGGDPSSSITGSIGAALHALAPGSVGDVAASVVTALGVAAAVGIVVFVSATTARRPLPATVGWALLAVGFLAPITYPWYALWGMVCLLPLAGPRLRVVLVAVSAFEAVATIPGAPGAGTDTVKVLVLAVALIVGVHGHLDTLGPRRQRASVLGVR